MEPLVKVVTPPLVPNTPKEKEPNKKAPVPVPEKETTTVDDGAKDRERATRASKAAAASAIASTSTSNPGNPPEEGPSKKNKERQRNKSGHEKDPRPSREAVEFHVEHTTPTVSSEPGKPLSREERKLQSVLKLIERMESNQKKKESRQTHKKDSKGHKDDEDGNHSDRDRDHSASSSGKGNKLPTSTSSASSASASQKRKGKKRGRSGSHSSKGKPQLISHRKSVDVRTTSTESDANSADEGREASPAREFRLPKTKRAFIPEWYNTPSSGELSLPQHYMRRSSSTPQTTNLNLTPTAATVSSASAVATPPSSLSVSVDNASAKKRWLRQAISEETDNPGSSPNSSRPMSPVTPECVAPLKKRRFARSSISSEVSNTPPLTPNNQESSEQEHENEEEENSNLERPAEVPDKGVSAAASSSLETKETEKAESIPEEENREKEKDQEAPEMLKPVNASNVEEEEEAPSSIPVVESTVTTIATIAIPSVSACPMTSPVIGRKSRWDQVESAVGNISPCRSPVKAPGGMVEPIILDYKRDKNMCMKLSFGTDGTQALENLKPTSHENSVPAPTTPTPAASARAVSPVPVSTPPTPSSAVKAANTTPAPAKRKVSPSRVFPVFY